MVISESMFCVNIQVVIFLYFTNTQMVQNLRRISPLPEKTILGELAF